MPSPITPTLLTVLTRVRHGLVKILPVFIVRLDIKVPLRLNFEIYVWQLDLQFMPGIFGANYHTLNPFKRDAAGRQSLGATLWFAIFKIVPVFGPDTVFALCFIAYNLIGGQAEAFGIGGDSSLFGGKIIERDLSSRDFARGRSEEKRKNSFDKRRAEGFDCAVARGFAVERLCFGPVGGRCRGRLV